MARLRKSAGLWIICLAAAALAGCAFSNGVPTGTALNSAVQKHSGPAHALLYSFGGYATDGTEPDAGLTDLDGVLYGTTTGGGSGCYASGGCGTVFAFSVGSGAESVLHNFTGGADGAVPYANVMSLNGTLYGTTGGGASTRGTVYSVTPSGTEKVLHDFAGRDGADPHATLIDVGNLLYGMTVFGGKKNFGTVYTIGASGKEHVIYSFLGTGDRYGARDGKYPDDTLYYLNGIFYGTTYKGGSVDRGTVFKLTPSGTETILHNFVGGFSDGSYPRAGLTYFKGRFYGTTSGGGRGGCKTCGKNPGYGTIFSITPGGKLKTLYKFAGYPTDGAIPYSRLVEREGVFYGTTQLGGANCAVSYGCGTIFSVMPSGKETMLYSFSARQGSYPLAGLVRDGNVLYGTTPSGGAYNHGTIFSLSGLDDGEHAQ